MRIRQVLAQRELSPNANANAKISICENVQMSLFICGLECATVPLPPVCVCVYLCLLVCALKISQHSCEDFNECWLCLKAI